MNKIILNKLELEIDACERELIKAINKTKHPIYKTFAKTNFNKYIIGNNINNYYRFIKNIKSYDFSKDLDNIIKYKYSTNTNYYLSTTIKKDKKVRLNVYSDDVQQATDIVREISELIESEDCPINKDTKEKDYSQIAILATSNDELKYYSELLYQRNIPYELKESKSIFDIKSSTADALICSFSMVIPPIALILCNCVNAVGFVPAVSSVP